MMKLSAFPWLLLGVFLNAGAQLLLKTGAQRISDIALTLSNFIPISIQTISNPFILLGLFCYGISVIIWIGVLSRVDVSVAYPMLSLGYVFNAIMAHYLFNETLSLTQISGILIILLGVYLLAK